MIYALTADGMRGAEEAVVSTGVGTLGELMERAGAALAHEVRMRVPDGAVAVVSGGGNNGGDGWAAARILHSEGRDVTVFSTASPDKLRGIAGDAATAALAAGVEVRVVADEPLVAGSLATYAVVLDALLGIGITGEVRKAVGALIDEINTTTGLVVAADVPSGIDATTGAVAGTSVEADVTVTFSAPKTGCVLYPGAAYAGELVVADLGIPRALLGTAGDPELWEESEYCALLPHPAPDAHKNARGRVLVVAGSGAYPGAAVLAALGAQRSGAGYLTVAAPESVVGILQTKLTSAIVTGFPQGPSRAFAPEAADALLDIAHEFDAVVLGPGMTLHDGAIRVARKFVASYEGPLVVDADGLNALAGTADALSARTSPTVITPHPGELARLLDTTSAAVQADRLSYARELSGPHLACVLKGAHSVVSGAARRVVTLAGNPGLATAGTGDVLAGMVGALLAQGLKPFEAAALGTYLHARAGDHASAAQSELAVLAEDLPAYLPAVLTELDDCG